MSSPTRLSLILLCLVFASPVLASNGVVEINQTRALMGGVTASDTPGFPVTLDSPGSYVLTSSLVLPDASTDGIEVSAPARPDRPERLQHRRTHRLQRPPKRAQLQPDGLGRRHSRDLARRRHDTGYDPRRERRGLRHGQPWHRPRRRLTDRGSCSSSTAVGMPSSSAPTASSPTLACSPAGAWRFALSHIPSPFEGSRLEGTGGGPTFVGATEMGGNTCGDALCSAVPKRRFYLTLGGYPATEATTACDPGFHFASLPEMVQPGSFAYDTTRGRQNADSGYGPPTTIPGWIRTGNDASSTPDAGVGNCNAWTTTSSNAGATVASIKSGWDVSQVDPRWIWYAIVVGCSGTPPVWCVQD